MEKRKREIITSGDGSHTVRIPELNTSYHSRHGAIQESVHVFIRAGLHHLVEKGWEGELNIFEMGFGTGLNAFLTLLEAQRLNLKVHYTAVEQFPLTNEEAHVLNYPDTLGHRGLFLQLHHCPWQKEERITDFFTLSKHPINLKEFSTTRSMHLIYFDAFDPATQPEVWTVEVFEQMYSLVSPGGLLLTYCSKGDVRRAMKSAGFRIKKIPGPWGKRDMVRGYREW
jgi:tRNA U34 5-methylaminomethyl-2-thiouridine-forming methyltransferase MnmC